MRRGVGWSLLLAGIVALAAVVGACRSVTDGGRDPRCIYVGDTLGVVKLGANGIVSECVWLTSKATTCFDAPLPRKRVRCVVGGSMTGERRS